MKTKSKRLWVIMWCGESDGNGWQVYGHGPYTTKKLADHECKRMNEYFLRLHHVVCSVEVPK